MPRIEDSQAQIIALMNAAGVQIPTDAEYTQMQTAHSWGDHSAAGYLTSVPVESVAGLTGAVSTSDLLVALNVADGATGDQTGAEIEALLDAELGTVAWKTGGSGGGAVDSVAGEVGVVTSAELVSALNASGVQIPTDAEHANFLTAFGWGDHALVGYLSDASAFATAAQGALAATATQPGDLGTAATADATDFATSAQGALADTATQPGDLGSAAASDVGDFATAAQGALATTATQPADLGTAAASDASDFATAAQGALADTATQPGDLGTAATAASTDFATAAQGALADSATQPGDLGTAAAADAADFATSAQGGLADTATQPGDALSTLTNDLSFAPVVSLTQAAYDALSPPTPGTIYLIAG